MLDILVAGAAVMLGAGVCVGVGVRLGVGVKLGVGVGAIVINIPDGVLQILSPAVVLRQAWKE